MPTPDQILMGLKGIANEWRVLAIIWHAYFAVFVLSLVLIKRPSKRATGLLLGLPLLSVSALAWVSANPFTGFFFGLAGMALLVISFKLPPEAVRLAPLWVATVGAFLFMFGWVYPHFLDTSSWFAYLYSAPVGLIPCPTLSVIIGLALVLRGLDSRAWSTVLGGTGVFYGVFGAARLGIPLDWVLFFGAVMILTTSLAGMRGGQANAVK